MISQMLTNGVFVTAGGQIYGVMSKSMDPQNNVVAEGPDGLAFDQFAAVLQQSPIFEIETCAVSNALGMVGLAGYAIGAAADLWLQRIAAGGTRMTGTNSTKWTISAGLIVPRSISVEDGGIARYSMTAYGISADGTTAPLVLTASSTMPAITALDEMFTLGPVSINGAAVGGVKRVTIDFGVTPVVEFADGEGYPTFVGIESIKPTVRFSTLHANQAVTPLGLAVAQGATDSKVFLRKLAKNGMRVANATAEHVSFSIDDGIVTLGSTAADNRRPAMQEYVITPTYDGTNDVLAVAVDQAIS